MTIITKHHSEEEGEGDHSKRSRVSFHVRGDTIHVSHELEGEGNIVRLEVSRRVQSLTDIMATIVVFVGAKNSSLEVVESASNVSRRFFRSPQEANESSFTRSHLTKSSVDSLLLNDQPFPDLKGVDSFSCDRIVNGVAQLLEVSLELLSRYSKHLLRVSDALNSLLDTSLELA